MKRWTFPRDPDLSDYDQRGRFWVEFVALVVLISAAVYVIGWAVLLAL